MRIVGALASLLLTGAILLSAMHFAHSTADRIGCGSEDTAAFWDAFQCGNHRGQANVFDRPAR